MVETCGMVLGETAYICQFICLAITIVVEPITYFGTGTFGTGALPPYARRTILRSEFAKPLVCRNRCRIAVIGC
jgi:hypothetical protein